MATATRTRVKVKAVSKSGRVARRAKPVTAEQVKQIVEETVAGYDPLTRIYSVGAGAVAATGEFIGAVATDATTALSAILDGLAQAGKAVWVFLGKIYDSVLAYSSAVIGWLGEQITYATGKVKDALKYVYDLVSSMSIDWVAVNSAAINLMTAAASFGLAVTVGGAVGLTMGTIALNVGASQTFAQIVALLFGAVTAGCLSEVCYVLVRGGVDKTVVAKALKLAEKRAAAC
jgi:hypothetical protein